jgi:hypothetical protein
MKILSIEPFVPSGADFEKSKKLFLDLEFTINWEVDGYAGDLQAKYGIHLGKITRMPYGKEVNLIDIAGVCWHFVEQ